MKTSRYQLKTSRMIMITYASIGGNYDQSLFNLLRLKKEQQIETTKNSITTCEKTLSKP